MFKSTNKISAFLPMLISLLLFSTIEALTINEVYELASQVPRNTPAFEEAEGFGKLTQGGRNGTLIKVTTLEDTGQPGSLRWAINQNYPRRVEFDVSGIITLKEDLVISTPFLTLDGSTAPGKGVTLKDGSLMVVETHDVIIRHMRVRPGDEAILRKGPWKGSTRVTNNLDAISVERSAYVIVDHCSATWSSDEVLSVTNSRNITVSNCIIAEPLSNPAVHIENGVKQVHPYGSLISGDGISLIKNIYAYLIIRAPQITREDTALLNETLHRVEIVNNYIFGFTKPVTRINLADRPALIHVLRNLYEYPLSDDASPLHFRYSIEGFTGEVQKPKVYLAGNSGEGWAKNQWKNVKTDLTDKEMKNIRIDEPVFKSNVDMWPVRKVREYILDDVGATLPVRGKIDKRFLKRVRNEKGDLVFSQDDVGGYND